jgi:hypothetical protein
MNNFDAFIILISKIVKFSTDNRILYISDRYGDIMI